MVAAARRRARELGLEESDELGFDVQDAAGLTLADSSVDGVLWRWGVMLVPDPEAAAAEVGRVLRRGSRAAVAVWADPAANDWLTAAGRSALELGLLERPAPDEPGPFRLSDEGRLQAALEAGGLAVDAVEDVPLTWRSRSLAEWWDVVRDTSRMLTQLLEAVGPDDRERIRVGAERRLVHYLQPDGSLAVPSVARVALASRPQ